MKSYIVVALVAVCCLGLNVALAQTYGDVPFSVDVSGAPLLVTVNTGIDIAGLSQGTTQTITPDGAGGALEPALTNPPLNGNFSVNSVGDIDITGDPGAQVLISFALPTFLFGSGGGAGGVLVSYNGSSACVVDVNTAEVYYFDPRVGTRTFLDPTGGATKVYLGGIFTVEANSAADIYVGDAVITVSYVGSTP